MMLRERIEEGIGQPLTDDRWAFLIEDGIVGDADADLNGAIVRVEKLVQVWGLSPQRRQRNLLFVNGPGVAASGEDDPFYPEQASSTAGRLRREMVSLLLAEDAAQLPEVQSFRGRRQLLTLEQVEPWIEEHGEPVSISQDAVTLWYGTHRDPYEHLLFIQPYGPLAELRSLSRMLAGSYGWTESQATVFVLTGLVPLIQRFKVDWESWRPRSRTVPSQPGHPNAGNRIVLTVDPTANPSEVRHIYARARRWLVGPRYQPVREKHARLALYTMERWVKLKWADRMEDWNREAPQWRYRHLSNFKRDCLKARERMLYPLRRPQKEV